MSWEIIRSGQFDRDLRKINKRRPATAEKVLENLAAYIELLEKCNNPLLVLRLKTNVHREASGCVAITEQPVPSNVAPLRLYLFASTKDKAVHLICIGDKNTQRKDNVYCQNYVKDNIK